MAPSLERILLPEVMGHEYEIGFLSSLGMRYKGKVISFDVADPSFDTPAHIKNALVSALKRKDATHYTRIRGLPQFVRAVSEFYSKKFGVEVDPMSEVLSTVGSGEALYIIFASMVGKGDEFIIPNPTFPNYAAQLQLHGGVARFVTTREDFHPDIGEIERAVTKQTKAIVLCTPNNPTGAVYSRKELEDVFRIAEKHDLLVISDENYSQITYDGRSHFSIGALPGAKERTIIANGLSKAYAMTGWRLGYIIARNDLIEQFEKIGYEIKGTVNTAVQYAGVAALNSAASVVKRMVSESNRRRKLMVKLIREAGFDCHMPEGGFEAFPKVPPGFEGSLSLAKFLAENAGVIVKPGVFFGPDGDRNFRVVYCGEEKAIEEGIARIAKAMRTHNRN